MDFIFQMQVVGGHWIVAAFRMIMMRFEEERVGSESGLYCVYVVLQGRLDCMKSVDVFFLLYVFILRLCIWGTAPV